MRDQISRKAREAEMKHVQDLKARAHEPITSYRNATWFQLEVAAEQGDTTAKGEMSRRRNYR